MKNSWLILWANVVGFAICFAAWVSNGVLITYLASQSVFLWSESQIAWLLAIPILSGSLVRFPLGILTDKFGGRILFTITLLLSSLGMWYESFASSYVDFIVSALIFGIAGGSFAVGVAYVSLCFEKTKQGFALGIFGCGNLGAGLTTLFAPSLLEFFTHHGQTPENWKKLPELYAIILVATALLYFLVTNTKTNPEKKSFSQLMSPLRSLQACKMSFYYFVLFGGYVALSQWLVVYYVNAYQLSIVTAGLLVTCFSIPSALMRIVGGKLADVFGAKKILRLVFVSALILAALLSIPMMDITTTGRGAISMTNGTVSFVSPDKIEVAFGKGEIKTYDLVSYQPKPIQTFQVFPIKESWQEPLVQQGDLVTKNQLIAKGKTHLFFQANVWLFSFFVIVFGLVLGVGMAAVYKTIPEHFPTTVGVVGGTVGMIGSLGGFAYPILFASLLQWSGFWTICWILFVFFIFLALRVEQWTKSR